MNERKDFTDNEVYIKAEYEVVIQNNKILGIIKVIQNNKNEVV